MKIAYLTSYASDDLGKWSGTGYFMHRALRESGLAVTSVGRLRNLRLPISIMKKLFYGKLRDLQYLVDRDAALLRSYARQAERRLSAMACDLVFSPGTLPLAELNCARPMVFWTDATFAGLLDFYPEYTGLCGETLRSGQAAEQAALDKCSLAIYSSEWAAASALANYRVDSDKVKVVPFGANLEDAPDARRIDAMVESRPTTPVQLLFVGVDWQRKGGDTALATAGELNRRGLETHLHVVGCRPPVEPAPAWLHVHGRLDKGRPDDWSRLKGLLAAAHFLIVPTRAECFGLVFAEASAFALPSLTFRVGGTASAVFDGENGFLFKVDQTGQDYAEKILEAIGDRERYEALCRSSFECYQKCLNWRVAGGSVRRLLETTVGASKGERDGEEKR